MASSIILTLLCTILTVTGLKEDRYAERENSTVGMDCNHEQENVTRVLWKYKSTHDNTTETIYDSQSNKSLRTGFDISCKHNQTFTSTCTLILIQARKEDSGKYICYVGQGNDAKFDSHFLKPIIEIELVIKGPIYKTIVVTKGDSVILPCEHNVNNLTRARWSHVSLQGVMAYQQWLISYMSWNTSSNNNYKGLCEPHQPSCNLKILQANKESAGRYICMVGESLEFEEKYGLDEMTYFIEIQLVVGELLCNENMNNLTLIGENDCYGIEADVLNLKCSFNYFGNINYNLLHLSWIQKYKFNSLEKKLNSSLINHEVKDETNKISIQTNLSVAYELQNSIFQCVLEDSLVKPCQLHEFRTQYIKNTTARSPPMHSNDLHNIKCSANKSANVQCSYNWVHEIAGAMVENPYAILPVENMNSPGVYVCIAKCHLGKHKECNIKAMDLEVIQDVLEPNLSGLNIGLMSAFAVVTFILLTILIIIAIIISLALKWRRANPDEGICKEKFDIDNTYVELLRKKNITEPENRSASPHFRSVSASITTSYSSHHLKEMCEVSKKEANVMIQNASLSLEVQQRRVESLPKHDADNTNSKHSGNKKSTKPENPGASPSLSSDSASPRKSHSSEEVSESAGATKMIEKSSFPLEIKEILVERTSKHGDIVIYESKSPFHSKVLMLDEAIWDTSFKGSSILKTMIFNLLEYYPKPKKVLVIGRCEGKILRTLIRRGVESIDVYDMGESGSGQAKELYNLYCNYFPDLARCLQHPKVSYIDGGVDFLKNQQNVFDVIIIRSSCKSSHDYLFTKKYFESVKSSLKEGGISLLFVSGQSIMESMGSGDFVKDDVQLLCKQLFPMVKYFRFPSFRVNNHPSCLTRGLLCGLNQGKDFEEL